MKKTALLLGALLLIATPIFYKKWSKKEKKEEVVYEPKTWEAFHEEGRLSMLIKGFAIESMVDLPCTSNIASQKFALPLKKYFGVSESLDVARALQSQYGSSISTYLHADITAELLPKVDLILAWDELCTLSPTGVQAALVHFKKSGAKFLLMRHYPDLPKNKKNKTGGFQPVNWTLPPYNFPQPLIQIMETKEGKMESLSLWTLDKL